MSSLLAEVLDAQRQAEEDDLEDERGLSAGGGGLLANNNDAAPVWEKQEDAWVRTHTGWGGSSRGSTRSMFGSSGGSGFDDVGDDDGSVLVASLRRLLDNTTVEPSVGAGCEQRDVGCGQRGVGFGKRGTGCGQRVSPPSACLSSPLVPSCPLTSSPPPLPSPLPLFLPSPLTSFPPPPPSSGGHILYRDPDRPAADLGCTASADPQGR